ncbi:MULTISPECIES: electron transport complex subunit RsxG [unclassified Agarivorans]|uniref:electron transport complex subunit RsxG n=1 Tax=unclassified Agarivorans TaxID=2636026 RepID=UPI0026E32636|nr:MULTISPECIES: electron transport complex subunit RsxG [unclassified Agarivorans]MDO6688104.1 electron transport complex subunit RsxG [Agarivorans sp. 3_MG-2023]MDO6717693.1 electron transport complex subunit RsxG [Agarivorans sp. 2_MG-2023]
MSSKRYSMTKNAGMLALFAFGCTLLVVIVNYFTAPRIEEQVAKQLLRSTNEVLSPELAGNDYQQRCYRETNQQFLGSDKAQTIRLISVDGQVQAFVYQTTAPDGYSGAIRLLVGVNEDGSVSGVRVVQHNETPGLGDKVETRKSDWIYQFDQQKLLEEKDPRWAVKKDGGQFDAFTGATITPRAVVKAVKNVLIYHSNNQQILRQSAVDC